MAEKTPQKQRGKGRPWKPGESGNPKGRPAGSGMSGQLREAIRQDLPEILAALVAKAKEGDAAAARVVLAKCLPDLRSEAAPVTVPGIADGSLSERAGAIMAAAGAGDIAPDLAATLLASIGTLARIRDFDELEERLRALEEATDAKR